MKKVPEMDWERLIPGHPGQPGGRLGTKHDVRGRLELLQTASAELKKLAQEVKCWGPAEKEFALPRYEKWPGYAAGLPRMARRYCGLWGRRLIGPQVLRPGAVNGGRERYGPRQEIRANSYPSVGATAPVPCIKEH